MRANTKGMSEDQRRMPDPSRVQEWRNKIDVIHEDVTRLAWSRKVFQDLAKYGGDASLPRRAEVVQRVTVWYHHDAMVAIRRILDPDASGGVISFRVLLEEMKRNADAMNRDSIGELADQRRIPKDESDFALRAVLVNSTWAIVSDDTGQRLDSRKIKADLKALDDVSDRIIRWVHNRIAHRTTEIIPEDEQPTAAEVGACIDLIHKLAIKYIAPLTGAGYHTLVPY